MKPILYLLLTVALAAGCRKSDTATDTTALSADSMAVRYYSLLANGQYAAYVAAMQSCDSTPPSYKQGMEKMLRHHHAAVAKEKKGVRQVSVQRTEMHNRERMANVFLRVTYNDNSEEEVLFPMVFDGKYWRIR